MQTGGIHIARMRRFNPEERFLAMSENKPAADKDGFADAIAATVIVAVVVATALFWVAGQ